MLLKMYFESSEDVLCGSLKVVLGFFLKGCFKGLCQRVSLRVFKGLVS